MYESDASSTTWERSLQRTWFSPWFRKPLPCGRFVCQVLLQEARSTNFKQDESDTAKNQGGIWQREAQVSYVASDRSDWPRKNYASRSTLFLAEPSPQCPLGRLDPTPLCRGGKPVLGTLLGGLAASNTGRVEDSLLLSTSLIHDATMTSQPGALSNYEKDGYLDRLTVASHASLAQRSLASSHLPVSGLQLWPRGQMVRYEYGGKWVWEGRGVLQFKQLAERGD